MAMVLRLQRRTISIRFYEYGFSGQSGFSDINSGLVFGDLEIEVPSTIFVSQSALKVTVLKIEHTCFDDDHQ